MDIIKKDIRRTVVLSEDIEETIIGVNFGIEFSMSKTMNEFMIIGKCLTTEGVAKCTFTQQQVLELSPLGIDVVEKSVQAVMNDITVRFR